MYCSNSSLTLHLGSSTHVLMFDERELIVSGPITSINFVDAIIPLL